ncbi:hypothetical protein HY633_01900 [Candidatus Uhrbacteria bacterium]|nr:hypothetical protein [Candidatus Uhrbacteria bacterium]
MKLRNALNKAIALPLAASSFVFAHNALAVESLKDKLTNSAQKTGTNAGLGSQDLAQSIGAIINGFFGLLGTVFVILMIYAGFLYMTAQGNEDQVEKAKTLIKNAIIGLVIMFLAYAITGFVITAVAS